MVKRGDRITLLDGRVATVTTVSPGDFINDAWVIYAQVGVERVILTEADIKVKTDGSTRKA